MINLKKCPFCGGEAKIQKDVRYPKNMSSGITAFEPVCQNPKCPIYMSDSKYYRTEAEAVTTWNTRAETEAEKKIKEATDYLEKFYDGLIQMHGKEAGYGKPDSEDVIRAMRDVELILEGEK